MTVLILEKRIFILVHEFQLLTQAHKKKKRKKVTKKEKNKNKNKNKKYQNSTVLVQVLSTKY